MPECKFFDIFSQVASQFSLQMGITKGKSFRELNNLGFGSKILMYVLIFHTPIEENHKDTFLL